MLPEHGGEAYGQGKYSPQGYPQVSPDNRFQKHHGITQPAATGVSSGTGKSQLGE